MQKILITAFLLLLFIGVKAQQLSNQIVGAFGSGSTSGGIMLEDHIGSISVSTIATPTAMYTQGFIQPDAGTTAGPVYINDVTFSSGSGIDNGGTTFINGGIMLEFTTAEFACVTLSNGSNTMLTQGILQPYSLGGTLPVTGMEFYAKRINSNTVQLDWKTIQEINNRGFHIERRKENEAGFNDIGFVSSKAVNGNSSFDLEYQKLDNNNFSGNIYYRLKQEDIDGRTTYSVVRLVKGDLSKQLTMQVWPMPAVSFFNVNVSGLEKPDMLQVLDMNGRLVKQLAVQNNTQQQVSGLPAGTYYIKLASDKAVGQKVIVQ